MWGFILEGPASTPHANVSHSVISGPLHSGIQVSYGEKGEFHGQIYSGKIKL